MEARQSSRRAIVAMLGGQTGLRRNEVTEAAQNDLTGTVEGDILWVKDAKAGYRETPVPGDLADRIPMIREFDDCLGPDDPVLERTPKRINRWVKRAGDELAAEDNKPG